MIWIGELFGRMSAVIGSRSGEKQLELIDLETQQRTVIETGVGPTQISVYEDGDVVRILSSNHGAGEVVLYTLSER